MKIMNAGVKGVTQTMADEALVQYQNAVAEYQKIGQAIPEGIQVGVDNGKPTLKGKIGEFVANLKSWFTNRDALNINSPSKWSEQVMEFVTDGMVIGLNNGKGEVMDTVDKLVTELKDRVSTALKGISNESENLNLKYQLWEKTDGSTATEEEKLAKKSELLTGQLDAEQNKVLILEQQYKSISEQYGEQHDLSIQASNDLIKEQVAIANLNNQLIELQNTKEKNAEANLKAIEEAKKAYDDYISKYGAGLREQGVSQKDIESAASRVSGYNPLASNGYDIAGNAINNMLSNVSEKASILSNIPKLNYVATGGNTSTVNNTSVSNTNNKGITLVNPKFEFNTTDSFNADEFLSDLESVVNVMNI